MNGLVAVGAIARRQHGLITFDQLLRLGVTVGQLRRWVHNGVLLLVRRRVYRLSGAPLSWPQAVLGSVLAAGPDAVASHTTAAALWDFGRFQHHDSAIHVTSPRQLRLEGVHAHFRSLRPDEQRVRNHVPVTSAERTILDLSGVVDTAGLGRCVDDALRRDLLRLDRLRQLVDRSSGSGRRLVRPLRMVLADRVAGYDAGGSDWEREMDRQWDKLALPRANRQYPVTANGHRYILDRALPELKIGVEWNGFATHGTRSAFDYDSDRRADLTAEGWHMVDFTSRSTPERVVAAVQGAIQIRSGPHEPFSLQ